MSGHRPGRPGRHGPWRTRHENPRPHLAAVHHIDHGRYEVALSPGADVADLVAAIDILPRGLVYTSHRPAGPEQPTTTILAFQKPPADPGGLCGVPAHPSPACGPPPPPARLLVAVNAVPGVDPGADPDPDTPSTAPDTPHHDQHAA